MRLWSSPLPTPPSSAARRDLRASRRIVAGGGGAGRQRAVYELSGIDSLLRDLIATTAETSRITWR